MTRFWKDTEFGGIIHKVFGYVDGERKGRGNMQQRVQYHIQPFGCLIRNMSSVVRDGTFGNGSPGCAARKPETALMSSVASELESCDTKIGQVGWDTIVMVVKSPLNRTWPLVRTLVPSVQFRRLGLLNLAVIA